MDMGVHFLKFLKYINIWCFYTIIDLLLFSKIKMRNIESHDYNSTKISKNVLSEIELIWMLNYLLQSLVFIKIMKFFLIIPIYFV